MPPEGSGTTSCDAAGSDKKGHVMTFRTGLLLVFAGGIVAPWLLAPTSSLVNVGPTPAASHEVVPEPSGGIVRVP